MADPQQSVIHGEPHSWDVSAKRYWVWRDGSGGYRIYDSEYPQYPGGDPKTLEGPIYPVGKTLGELALLLK